MAARTIYSEILLDNYRHPRNRGQLEHADATRRGRNPRCGDEIEVAVRFEGDRIGKAAFRGRGCSISIASASMMTEVVAGRTAGEVSRLLERLRAELVAAPEQDSQVTPVWLAALGQIREHPARHRCVLLPWEALAEAVEETAKC